MTRFRKANVAVLIILSATLCMLPFGCTLDRQGLKKDGEEDLSYIPETYCTVSHIDHKLDPLKHAYKFVGVCLVGFVPAIFDVEASWKSGSPNPDSSAHVKVNYYGHDLEINARAECPQDPMIYDNVNCSDRRLASVSGPGSEIWGYYQSVFKNHMMPALFCRATGGPAGRSGVAPYRTHHCISHHGF